MPKKNAKENLKEAMNLFKKGDLDKCIHSLNKALKLDPTICSHVGGNLFVILAKSIEGTIIYLKGMKKQKEGNIIGAQQDYYQAINEFGINKKWLTKRPTLPQLKKIISSMGNIAKMIIV